MTDILITIYQLVMKIAQVRPATTSMSRAYRSIDNAEMESFFQKLKGEYLKGKNYCTIKQARKYVASYIDRFYNPRRLHSSLGYLSPMEFEARAA